MGKPKAPKPPDPYETAQAQRQSDVSTARFNQAAQHVNQYGPDGSIVYAPDGRHWVKDPNGTDHRWRKGQDPSKGPEKGYWVDQWSVTTELSPAQQRLKDLGDQTDTTLARAGLQQAEAMEDHFSRPADVRGGAQAGLDGFVGGYDASAVDGVSGRGANPTLDFSYDVDGFYRDTPARGNLNGMVDTYGTDFSADRRRVEDALTERMNPDLRRREEATRARLANAGVTAGSEAWKREMQDVYDAENRARLDVILAGGGEQSRLADLEARRAGFERDSQVLRNADADADRAAAFGEATTRAQQEAARSAFGNQSRVQQDAMDDADSDEAFSRALAEIQTNAQQAAFGNQAALQKRSVEDEQRAARIAEDYQQRNQPINEISALMSGTQVSGPSLMPVSNPGVANLDMAGLINDNYNQRLAGQQMSNQQWQTTVGGLFGLAGSGAQAAALMYGAPRGG